MPAICRYIRIWTHRRDRVPETEDSFTVHFEVNVERETITLYWHGSDACERETIQIGTTITEFVPDRIQIFIYVCGYIKWDESVGYIKLLLFLLLLQINPDGLSHNVCSIEEVNY